MAAEHFAAASALRPAHVGVRLDLAHAVLRLGDAAGALRLAAAAATDAPHLPLAWLRLGEARRALGDAAGARAAFAAAVAADPGHARARAELAAATMRVGVGDPPADGRRDALVRAWVALRALDPLAARAALGPGGAAANASRPAALLAEAALDPALLARLVALRPLPQAERVAPLRALVAAAPEITLVAHALLAALAAADAWAAPGGGSVGRDAPVPPRGGRPSVAAIPARAATFLGAAAAASGVHAFDEAAAAQFLANQAKPEVGAAFAAADPTRRRDLFRLAWLHAAGGLWLDTADHAAPPPGADFAARFDAAGCLTTGWLAAAPGNAIIGRALAAATRSIAEGAREAPWLATGAGLVTRAYATEFAVTPDVAGWLRRHVVLPPVAAPRGHGADGLHIALDLPDLDGLT